jgi:hypothetical protein
MEVRRWSVNLNIRGVSERMGGVPTGGRAVRSCPGRGLPRAFSPLKWDRRWSIHLDRTTKPSNAEEAHYARHFKT